MKAKKIPGRDLYRIIVPSKLNDTGKQKALYFKTKELANAEIQRITGRGSSTKPNLSDRQLAILKWAETEDLPIEEIPEAFRRYRATVLNVTKRAHLLELCDSFILRQEHEGRRERTLDDDRQRLTKFRNWFGNIDVTTLTETGLRQYLDHYPPGSNRRSHYKCVRKFIRWAHHDGYLPIDPMIRIKPKDKWGVNNELVEIDHFRRLLFVCAGLEPIEPDGTPTTRYLPLLPYYVLGGLAGMRRAEMLRDRTEQSILQWRDILWDKGLISIRDEVAKQTRAQDRRRWIPLEPAAREWLLMVKRDSGPVVEIWQSTHTKLKKELFEKLDLSFPENGLRNSYASYAQTFRSAGEVAKATGDLESTLKRFYTQPLEPGDGHAWFDIRPTGERKIVPMTAA